MANLTITVPDEVLRRARVRAAEEGTSVSKVLRTELERYASVEERRARALDEFLALVGRSKGSSGPGGRSWTRESIQRFADR